MLLIQDPNEKSARCDSENVDLFSRDISEVLKPHRYIQQQGRNELESEAPVEMNWPIQNVTYTKNKKIIKNLVSKNLEYDLTSAKVLEELDRKAVIFLISQFNGIIQNSDVASMYRPTRKHWLQFKNV